MLTFWGFIFFYLAFWGFILYHFWLFEPCSRARFRVSPLEATRSPYLAFKRATRPRSFFFSGNPTALPAMDALTASGTASPLPPQWWEDAAGVSHAPAGCFVGPLPTDAVRLEAPGSTVESWEHEGFLAYM